MSLIESDEAGDGMSDEEIDTAEGLGSAAAGANPNATHDNPFFISDEWVHENHNVQKAAAIPPDSANPTEYNSLCVYPNHIISTGDQANGLDKDIGDAKDLDVAEETGDHKGVLHDELHGKLTFWLALSTVTVSIGSGSQLGYNGGGFSVPAPFLENFLNHTNYDKWNGAASDVILTWIFACTVSMFVAGAAIGSMLAGQLSDIRGRKGSLLISNVLSIAGAILMGVCQVADIYGLLVMGRFIVGLYVGIAVSIMPIYLAEIAPINLRGSIGVFSAMMVAAGTVVAHVLYFGFFYSQELWVVGAALTGVLSVFELILLPFCPESPRWLLINQDRPIEAEKALQKLRVTDDVQTEMDEMRLEAERQTSTENVTVMDILKLKLPEWKMPLILSVTIMTGVHLSGFSTVMYYTTAIYQAAGMSESEIAFATVGFSTLNMLMTGVSVLVVERVGRRPLLLYPFMCMAGCLIGLTVSIGVQDKYDWMKWLSIVFVYIDISAYAIGPMSIKNLVATELWLQGPRPAALSISFQLNYWCSVFVSLTFPVFEAEIGSFTFLIYLGFLIITFMIVFLYFPETKNKTFDQIAAEFSGKSYEQPHHPLGDEYEMRDIAEDGVRQRAYSALSAASSQGQFTKNVPGTQWM